jgi:N-acetylglucosaminyldiphosphoundecaprenol N-acetyl-beta-D-mannosaminyltransferase
VVRQSAVSTFSEAEKGSPEFLTGRVDGAPRAIDDLSRKVYCVLGLPLDAFDMDGALKAATTAAMRTSPCLLSTPNLNFLISSLNNEDFRKSVLLSDMSLADGMPLIWIARLLGLPIRERVAGSELFEKMVEQLETDRKIKVFFFGGADGIAEKASAEINANSKSVRCVGTLNPGFGTIEQMSSDTVIDRINASGADFLVVALGAQKGQEWLLRNHDRLTVPLRSHLGACMNFQAGTVARAPRLFQKYGLEWLWRIKEEPQLWRRYWHDGLALLRLALTRVAPLAVKHHVGKRLWSRQPQPLEIAVRQELSSRTLVVRGHAVEHNIEDAIRHFRSALDANSGMLTVDLSEATAIDQRFLGLLMMARKTAAQNGIPLRIRAGSRSVRRMFELNEADCLLAEDIRQGDAANRRPAVIPVTVATGDA